MMPDKAVLFATIILLLPMLYFLLAAPAFLLVRLDIPPVALLLRTMFNGYFLTLAIAGLIGTIAVAVAGRLVLAISIGLIAAFAASSLVFAADGCPAWWQRCWRFQCRAPAATAALGRHAEQCDPACRYRGRLSSYRCRADLISP
jgi:hypothetical protein